jgi:ketosteroid isomerase-like protein
MPDARSVVGEFLRRLGEWGADAIGEPVAEEIDWLVPGAPGVAWEGPRTRREEDSAYCRTTWSHIHTERSASAVDQIVVEGDDAVVLGTFSHEADGTGHRWTTPVALHVRVERGLITRVHVYEDTYAVAGALGVRARRRRDGGSPGGEQMEQPRGDHDRRRAGVRPVREEDRRQPAALVLPIAATLV